MKQAGLATFLIIRLMEHSSCLPVILKPAIVAHLNFIFIRFFFLAKIFG